MRIVKHRIGYGNNLSRRQRKVGEVVSRSGPRDNRHLKLLDVDLSKLKYSEFLDKLFASLPIPPGEKPDLKLTVERYVLQLWINP